MKSRRMIFFFFLLCAAFGGSLPVDGHFDAGRVNASDYFEKYHRTELYFGLNRPDGKTVTDEEWSVFLTDEVTPRFPAGLTVIAGFGQFKDAGGRIVRENSRVLVLFYPRKMRREASLKIEEIRAAYKKQFLQESILRLDFTRSVNVSF
jgi:hypothetical protein